MTWLLDGNVLVALADTAHVHHRAAHDWFAAEPRRFATCPITQGTLVRMLLRHQAVEDAGEAAEVLRRVEALPRHEFWAEDFSYSELRFKGVLGHRQVTDAYLAELARRRKARLATLDRGLAAVHADIADWIGAPSIQESRGST